MTFGRHLRHLRFMRRMPLQRLAAATGLDPDHLVDFESGRDVPTREEAAKLATAPNVPQEGLLEKARHVRPSTL